jgi:hypothetical protein
MRNKINKNTDNPLDTKKRIKQKSSGLKRLQEEYIKCLVNNSLDAKYYNEEILDHIDDHMYHTY